MSITSKDIDFCLSSTPVDEASMLNSEPELVRLWQDDFDDTAQRQNDVNCGYFNLSSIVFSAGGGTGYYPVMLVAYKSSPGLVHVMQASHDKHPPDPYPPCHASLKLGSKNGLMILTAGKQPP